MTYKQKADLVAWWHLAFILYGIICLPLLFLITWWYQLVFILVGFSIFSWVVLRCRCSLTEFENNLRRKDPTDKVYSDGFLKHYLKKVFKINLPSWFIGMIMYTYSLVML